MSKFFQALERAKRERMLQEQSRRSAGKGPADTAGSPDPAFLQREKSPAGKPAESGFARRTPAPSTQPDERIRTGETSFPKDAPSPRGIEEHLVSLLSPSSFAAEQYRTLRHIVEHMRRECDLQVVAVTSPAVGDGKTTTAINLAGAFAQSPGARVLVVDADLRHPALCQQLGLPGSDASGLTEAILDQAVSLKDLVLHHSPFNLSVLAVGRMKDTPYEVLRSPRLGEVLNEARRQYDFVILDTPPLLSVPDCRVIAKWVDGFIVVVAAHQTPRKLLEEALNVMNPDKMVGLVFNTDERPLMGYDGRYYPGGHSLSGSAWNGRRARNPRWRRLSSAAS